MEWNEMKRILFILCLFILTLKAYNVQAEVVANSLVTSDEYLQKYIDALINDDENAAFELWIFEDTQKDREDFSDIYSLHKKGWGNRENYTYKKTEERITPADGAQPEMKQYTYQVNCEDRSYTIVFSIVESFKGRTGIASFSFYFIPEIIGTLKTFRQFNFFQWLLLFISIGEIVFSIYVIYLCIKDRTKFWFLWVILILIIYGGVTISNTSNWGLSIFAYAFKLPQLLIYTDLGIQVTLSVPLVAIGYYINRKLRAKK